MIKRNMNRYRSLEFKRHQLSRFISRVPRIESLEARCVLASVGIEAGLLAFNNDGVEDNDLTVSATGGQLTLHDAGNEITAGAGVTRLDANTVSVPVADVSRFEVHASGGDDTLRVDYSGDPLSFDIDYFGGDGFDDLVVEGGYFPAATYNATGVGAGDVVIGDSTIHFDELEPVTVTAVLGTLTIQITDGLAHEVVLQDVTGINNSEVTIDGGLENVSFANPANQLTIRASNADDTIVVRNLETTFSADILIEGGGGNDTFQIVPAIAAPIFVNGNAPALHETGFPPGDVLALDLDNVLGVNVDESATAGVATSLSHATVQWIGIERLITPDRLELNDSIELATVLGSLPKITLSDLSIHPRVDEITDLRYADVVVVVDESMSMDTEHAFLADFIPDLEAALTGVGIGVGGTFGGNQYGLVGFGGAVDPIHLRGHSHLVGGNLFGTASEFVTASGTLVLTGTQEDGYDGIEFALDNYPLRSDALHLVILVTDDDRAIVNPSLTKTGIAADLLAADATLHAILDVDLEDGVGAAALAIDGGGTAYLDDGSGGVIVSSGGVATAGAGTTIDDYVDLVFQGNGLAGDLNQIRNGGDAAESFANAMLIDLVESIDVPDPVPDVDLFQYTAQDTGKLIINLHMDDDIGDLDLRVLGSDGSVLATSVVSTDNEKIVMPVVTQVQYFIEVSGATADQINNYALEIENFPAPIPSGLFLDPDTDTGMMNDDNVTADDTPNFFAAVALDAFENMGIPIITDPSDLGPGASLRVQARSLDNAAINLFATPVSAATPDLWVTDNPFDLTEGVWIATAFTRIRDAAGNIDDVELSPPLLLVIDTMAPNDPAAPNLLEASDSGDSSADNVTHQMQPAFDGTAEPNANIRLFANDQQVGQTVAGTDGSWEITAEPLVDGTYTIAVDVEDLAGNVNSDRSNTTMMTVDVLPPQRPTIDLLEEFDTGMSNVDDITRLSNLTFRITGDPGESHVIKDGNTPIINIILPASGEAMLALDFEALEAVTDFPAEGPHPMSIEAFDLAGNRSLPSPLLLTIIDLTTPDASAITIDMLSASDTGPDSTDNITSKMQPAFQGVAEENTKIRLYAIETDAAGVPMAGAAAELIGQSVVGSDTSDVGVGGDADDGLGLWEITVEPLRNGFFDISVELEDLAGNSTDPMDGPTLNIEIDGLATQRPTVDLVGVDVRDSLANVADLPAIVTVAPIPSDTGVSTTDNVTAGVDPQSPGGDGTTDVQLRISAEPNAEVVVKDGEQIIATFTMPNEPFVLLYLDDILDEDPHPISVETTDPAGNRSAQSEELLVTVDVTPPAPPPAPDLNASSDSGMNNTDDVTNIQQAHFTGTAEANSHIRVYAIPVAGNVPIGVAQLVGEGAVGSDESDGAADDGLGLYEVTIEPLEDGVYNIVTQVEDQAGNVSETSDALQIEIDTYEPNTAYLDLREADDSGRHNDDNVTNVTTPIFTATTHDPNAADHILPANFKYRIYDRSEGGTETLIYDSFVTLAGFTPLDLVTTPGLLLGEGDHDLKLEVEDRAGNISHDFLLSVVIDTQAFLGDVDLHPDSDTGVWGFSATMVDRISSDTVPDFFGVAEANNLVTLAIDGSAAGTTVAVPLDGDDAFQPLGAPYDNVHGNWRIATNLNLTDGEHTAVATFEDLAGNRVSAEPLLLFTDTQGPRVTAVEVNDPGNPYDLFDPKPSTDGPTPRVDALVISVTDFPLRTANFLYDPMFAALATDPGNYKLAGDTSGIVPIASIAYASAATPGNPATATITLGFSVPLPDDRFTLTVSDSISDVAGNSLDGESNSSEPQEFPSFPSGDGVHGGDFVARFTVDSRPEIATWSQGVVYADINGNFVWDPEGQDNDATNRDFVYNFGEITDAYFAGNFSTAPTSSGFDKLGVYGRFSGVYQFFLDTDDDGVGDLIPSMFYQVNAVPVAGNFFNSAADQAAVAAGERARDEIGAFDGQNWYLDVNGNNQIDNGEQFPTSLRGIPVVGDFNGDGFDDLATFNNNTGQFEFDLDRNGTIDDTLTFGFSGFGDRPVAGDFNLDGVDDIGLWVPGRDGQLPKEAGEWYFLISDQVDWYPDDEWVRIALPSAIFDPYSPAPLGNDLFAQFGDEFALPLFGNFDPPVTSDGGDGTFVGAMTNQSNRFDTNVDGRVSALDALVVINAIARNDFGSMTFSQPLRAVASLGGFLLDASGDGSISALDALQVINELSRQSVNATGEQVDWAQSADSVIAELDDEEDGDLLALLASDQENQRVKS